MTDTNTLRTAGPAEYSTAEQIKALVEKAGSNPSALEFPTDKWGFTSKVRKEVLLAAQNVRGQDDKHLLLLGTLLVLTAHIKARLPGDKLAKAQRLAEQAAAEVDREKRNRVAASPAPVASEGVPNG